MSVKVEFSSLNEEYTQNVLVPYAHGDYEIQALHLTCVVNARKYGENYIKKILEPMQVKQ